MLLSRRHSAFGLASLLCSVAQAATSWTWCATEGANCNFSGTQTVRYGTTTQTVDKVLSNGTVCTNAVFGDPAPGVAKQCWVANTTTATTTSTSTGTTATSTTSTASASYSMTQVFPLANTWVSGEQGQYANISLRFYGVPLGVNSKVFVHLYNGSSLVAATGHHLRYLASASWNGYLQFEHPVYIPSTVPTGTYRVSIGLYYYQSPWSLLMSQLQGNGVSLLSTSTNNAGYEVGKITVTPATKAAAVDATSGDFLAITPTYWK